VLLSGQIFAQIPEAPGDEAVAPPDEEPDGGWNMTLPPAATPARRHPRAPEIVDMMRRAMLKMPKPLEIVPCVAALLASLALASAYENATILPVLFELGLPPLVAFLFYQSSPKAVIAPLLLLAVAALGLDVFGVSAMSGNPIDGLLLVSPPSPAPSSWISSSWTSTNCFAGTSWIGAGCR
jgi:hypothetical protein